MSVALVAACLSNILWVNIITVHIQMKIGNCCMRKSYTALFGYRDQQLRDPFIDAKRSIIKCAINEITKNNVSYCKELKSVIHELRNT